MIETTDDVQVPRVYLAWRGPPGFTADEPALDALAAILGDGKSSRLYKRLVYDEKIAQDVNAGFSGEQLGGQFEIVVTAKPGVDPKRLIKEISEEVAKIAAAAARRPRSSSARKNSQEAGVPQRPRADAVARDPARELRRPGQGPRLLREGPRTAPRGDAGAGAGGRGEVPQAHRRG